MQDRPQPPGEGSSAAGGILVPSRTSSITQLGILPWGGTAGPLHLPASQ